MDYKNDERYWNINLLNKWFAISSILFLLSIGWMFLNDNDDEFKEYQREFRRLESNIAQEKLLQELDNVSLERDVYENKFATEQDKYTLEVNELDSLNELLVSTNGIFYKSNMDYLFFKAEVDQKKYLYEKEIVESHHDNHGHSSNQFIYKNEYESSLIKLNSLKLIKEALEKDVELIENIIRDIRSDLKGTEDELNKYLNKVNF